MYSFDAVVDVCYCHHIWNTSLSFLDVSHGHQDRSMWIVDYTVYIYILVLYTQITSSNGSSTTVPVM